MARRGYVQLVNGFYDNDKIRDLVRMGRADSVGVYCMALSLCGDRLTDGFVPRRAMLSNIGATPEQVQALVDEGMLEEVEEGWLIHDYAEHNRTKEQVLHARKKSAERVAKHRNESDVTALHRNCNAVTSGQTPEHQNPKERERRIFFFFLQRNHSRRIPGNRQAGSRPADQPSIPQPRPHRRMGSVHATPPRRNPHDSRLDTTLERLVPTQSQHERHPTLETPHTHVAVRTRPASARTRQGNRHARPTSLPDGETTQQGEIMKHNPFEIAFGIVLAVCLCVAPIIIFTIS